MTGNADQPIAEVPPAVGFGEGITAQTLARVADLQGSINTNFAVIREQFASQHEKLTDHEARLRLLEKADNPKRSEFEALEGLLAEINRWRWKLVGSFAAVSVLCSAAAVWATTLIQAHH
jgi:hypothetical protein